jgi:hypothetical protein
VNEIREDEIGPDQPASYPGVAKSLKKGNEVVVHPAGRPLNRHERRAQQALYRSAKARREAMRRQRKADREEAAARASATASTEAAP